MDPCLDPFCISYVPKLQFALHNVGKHCTSSTKQAVTCCTLTLLSQSRRFPVVGDTGKTGISVRNAHKHMSKLAIGD